MSHSESKLTPAQAALLHFVSHREASSIFTDLSLTVRYSVTHFSAAEFGSHPLSPVFEAWHRTLELMEHIHAIAAERPEG